MSTKLTESFTESGILVALPGNKHDKPSYCETFYNPVMKICREIVLCAASALVTERKEKRTAETPFKIIKCLDAFGASGVAGMQWKKHLKGDIWVTINDLSVDAFENIKHNCMENKFQICTGNNQSKSSEEKPVERTDMSMALAQKASAVITDNESMSIEVLNMDANILLHSRQFTFIHIDPFGTTVQYLEAAFHNIYHQGVVVLTSTDVAALYGKCPQVMLRNYGAHAHRCDYMKELAARIILASAARAAARSNKGFEVLYAVAVEHFVQVAVRIQRGARYADRALAHVSMVLHCRSCEEWGIASNHNTLQDNHYSELPCSCQSDKSGMAGIKLGPAWCGDIFNGVFISKMFTAAETLKLSPRLRLLMGTLVEESTCHKVEKCTTNDEASSSDSIICANMECLKEYDDMNQARRQELKRQMSDSENLDSRKKMKCGRNINISTGEQPLFYYNIHKRRVSNVDVPKTASLVVMLKKEGFRASCTHFDSHAVRTTATLEQFKTVMKKYFSQSKLK